MGGRDHHHVLFQFRTPARQVYLMARSARDPAWSLNPMAPSHGDDSLWELLLPLPPGRHRVRYYVDDGRRTVYFEPTNPAEATIEGLDLVVNVPEGSDAGLFVPLPAREFAPRASHPVRDPATDEHRWAK